MTLFAGSVNLGAFDKRKEEGARENSRGNCNMKKGKEKGDSENWLGREGHMDGVGKGRHDGEAYLLSTPLYPLGNPPGLRSSFGAFEICLEKGAVGGYGKILMVDAECTCAWSVDPRLETCK